MRSPRYLVVSALVIGALSLFALLRAPGVQAAPPLSVRTLDGAYHFIVSEIRDEAGTLVYCNAYGLVVFDGAGRADIRAAWGYGTCNPDPPGGNPVEDGCFAYAVGADGNAVLTDWDLDPATEACTEPVDPAHRYVTHCQILDKGNLLLCDGAGGSAGAVIPDGRLIWSATAGKL